MGLKGASRQGVDEGGGMWDAPLLSAFGHFERALATLDQMH